MDELRFKGSAVREILLFCIVKNSLFICLFIHLFEYYYYYYSIWKYLLEWLLLNNGIMLSVLLWGNMQAVLWIVRIVEMRKLSAMGQEVAMLFRNELI